MIIKAIPIALIPFIFLSICSCDDQTITSGFTVDLIHRDSPLSPSYNPSSPPSQRLAGSFARSFDRMQKINAHHRQQRQPQPDIVNSVGEYYMKFSVGTPPVPQLGTADTGSDLTWTQCQPCFKCFNQTLPYFVPANSSTFRPIRCYTPQCLSFPRIASCSINGRICRYSQTYGDGAHSAGMLATETITFGPSVSIPHMVFGCGFSNEDKFAGVRSGIVGLGRGKGSFVRQLGPLAQGRFSYCLVSLSDVSNSSKLNFGGHGLTSDGGVILTTPMVTKDPETFYHLTLEGISVGNSRIGFLEPALASNSASSREGNIIIDSGTTLMMFPPRLYEAVENAVKSSVKLEAAEDPLGVLSVCYLWREDDAGFPDVTVHFRGADVQLETENVFVRTSEETVCLAVVPAEEGGVAIYGNLAQVNFLVGFDLVKKTVSFKRANCGKQ